MYRDPPGWLAPGVYLMGTRKPLFRGLPGQRCTRNFARTTARYHGKRDTKVTAGWEWVEKDDERYKGTDIALGTRQEIQGTNREATFNHFDYQPRGRQHGGS